MLLTTLDSPELIALEVAIPETLFRSLQALLDQRPSEDIDSLFAQAVRVYLTQLETLPQQNLETN